MKEITENTQKLTDMFLEVKNQNDNITNTTNTTDTTNTTNTANTTNTTNTTRKNLISTNEDKANEETPNQKQVNNINSRLEKIANRDSTKETDESEEKVLIIADSNGKHLIPHLLHDEKTVLIET